MVLTPRETGRVDDLGREPCSIPAKHQAKTGEGFSLAENSPRLKRTRAF